MRKTKIIDTIINTYNTSVTFYVEPFSIIKNILCENNNISLIYEYDDKYQEKNKIINVSIKSHYFDEPNYHLEYWGTTIETKQKL